MSKPTNNLVSIALAALLAGAAGMAIGQALRPPAPRWAAKPGWEQMRVPDGSSQAFWDSAPAEVLWRASNARTPDEDRVTQDRVIQAGALVQRAIQLLTVHEDFPERDTIHDAMHGLLILRDWEAQDVRRLQVKLDAAEARLASQK